MRPRLSRDEALLLAAVAALLAVALLGPVVRQPGDYHRFADQRLLWAVPRAMDVLSNVGFALVAVLGLAALRQRPNGPSPVQRATAAVLFAGLGLTAMASGWYHLAPDETRLAIDRAAMAVAFSGLLGLAGASRIGDRAGVGLGLTALLAGPLAALAVLATGNVLPWAVLQFGAMALLLLVAVRPARPATVPVPLLPVLALYALAKLLELNDAPLYELTGRWLSGHSLKHLVAALAVVPVLLALRPRAPGPA